MLRKKFTFIPQYDQMDCGPACLAMVARHYGKEYALTYLRESSFITREGVSMRGISEAAEQIGLASFTVKIPIQELIDNFVSPVILYWNKNHFVVLHRITRNRWTGTYRFHIADPGHGLITLGREDFEKCWITDNNEGVTLFLNTTEAFFEAEEIKTRKLNLSFILSFLRPYKREVTQLFMGLLAGSIFSLIFPFLTQALIDKGIANNSLNIIFLILLAQVFLFLGSMVIQVVRNWIMLYMGTRINITIISEFLAKILKLPIKFFDTKLIGDFNQRIQDHERIEEFLTSQSLVTFFSLVNFSVFFFVLFYYDVKIVLVYTFLTACAILWSVLFLKKRKILDYYRFQRRSENQESIYELINGVQEIKLNNFEDYKREEWERIQVKLFNVNLRILKLNQFQLIGYDFINQFKNILVTFIAAREVVLGNITLGAMLAVAYIIGQMNSPVNQLIDFFRSLQDAKLSLERLSEVQDQPNEEKDGQVILDKEALSYQNGIEKGIRINNLHFQYEGPKSPYVLEDIDLFMPEGKTTAIVGASGSGKTTLMKLLLRFYEPAQGSIHVNQHDLNTLAPSYWRHHCGVVMQEGYIFSATIERNIATGDAEINHEKLRQAIRIANIEEFVDSLPLGLKTKIGAAGNGISGGQKQRILIARAVYKDPHFIFFDEATSALDAENEKVIHDNLQSFFNGKTVMVIAHRLSTVKNADQIVVLKNGRVVELGTHEELVEQQQDYYNLVRNQLELGV
ncbi:peptidase domain-containing ABC transporter [Altibacter sp. HG106]|uniref:peptidase domain-containing ABC transporter n=1 Tax=Altibacter sp. HG106 TaxID=3023937 RepID=UPI0023509954|nr:peptidase domain-containing ABC transporter [Altibacter sp. HG106]MDC7995437.1 peptidase domain-containing ABC transporter [Altibacter sp. HG106]